MSKVKSPSLAKIIFFSFFSKENDIFFILPEKCLVSSSLVPPMILLTKVDEPPLFSLIKDKRFTEFG